MQIVQDITFHSCGEQSATEDVWYSVETEKSVTFDTCTLVIHHSWTAESC